MKKIFLRIAVITSITLFSRLLPHPPDFTPMVVLAMFYRRYLQLNFAIGLMLLNLLLTDGLPFYLQHYPWFGVWTVFTYSGILGTVVCAKSDKNCPPSFGFALFATVFYWIWTNFGVWMSGTFYAESLMGIIKCYEVALPFLYYAIVGTLVWFVVVFKIVDYSVSQHVALKLSR